MTANSEPLNGPGGTECDYVGLVPSPHLGQLRNGSYLNRAGRQTPGVAVGGTATGIISRTTLHHVADGLGLQSNWNALKHIAMLGLSLACNHADYRMTQRLGLIDAAHQVYESPDNIDGIFGAAFTGR